MATFSQLFKNSSYQAAIDRFSRVARDVQHVQEALANSEAVISEYNSSAQCAMYEEREIQIAKQKSRMRLSDFKTHAVSLERSIGRSNDILSIEFFEAGLLAARPVGYISVNFGAEEGTGFLVGNGLLLTNNHVIPDKETADSSSVEFDRESNQYGEPKRAEQFDFDRERFFSPIKCSTSHSLLSANCQVWADHYRNLAISR
jgi:S1-C subfamily serine protease